MKKKLATKTSTTSSNEGANGGGSGKVGTNTRLPKLKFIDSLEKELRAAGIRIKRSGWEDYSFDANSKRLEKKDPCEWITIITKSKDGKKKYEVQFYFSNGSKTLYSVNVYVKKKKRGYGGGNLIGMSDYKEKPQSELPPKKEESPSITTSGWVTINVR